MIKRNVTLKIQGLKYFSNRYLLFKSYITILQVLAVLFSTLILVSCSASKQASATTNWVSTWSTSQQLVEPRNLPPEPGLTDNTLRQVVRVSIGGDSLKVRFSNKFSTYPVTMKEVHFAASVGGSAIDPNYDVALTFDGKPDVTMEPGAAVTSDLFSFPLKPCTDVTITIYFGDTSPDVTGHPGSRTTSYIQKGDAVDSISLPNAATTDHWYVIDRIDVTAPESAGAVVVLGNSITDGRGSGTNKQNRWPDVLADRFQENFATLNVAVVNSGIGGNCVLRNCLGPSALSRFDRDVIDQKGVKWLIILEGINDIGGIRDEEQATKVTNGLIDAYQQMIDKAHAAGIKVYGATLTPFAGSFYDTPERIDAWKKVNEWIRTSGRFDAVIDLDKTMEDPANPLHMLPEADSGDHLHPSELGHKMMGDAVDLKLFR